MERAFVSLIRLAERFGKWKDEGTNFRFEDFNRPLLDVLSLGRIL